MQYHNTDANKESVIHKIKPSYWYMEEDLYLEDDISNDFKQNQNPRSAPCTG